MVAFPKDEDRVASVGGVSSIDGKTPVVDYNDPSTHAKLVEVSSLPLPSGAATSAKQDTGNNSLANLDVALSTRTKPSDQQHTIIDSGTITGIGLTAGFAGQSKIAVTSTAVQLGSQVLTNGVILTAKSTNVNPLVIGGSGVTNVSDGTGTGYILEAGASISCAVTNLNVLYFNGSSGDVLSWLAC